MYEKYIDHFIVSLIEYISKCIFVYFLWNWFMPEIFNIKYITFIQSMQITLLVEVFVLYRSNIDGKINGRS